VFKAAGLEFSTPICFEDTFGYLSRRFVNSGARAIINVSNDAWAGNLTCQYQHLSMSVFRSVENRVPLVRSTATGQTCIVDPNGRITAMATPFTETVLIGQIPVLSESPKSVYRVCGDLCGILFAAGGIFLLAAGMLTRLRKVYEN
jgi:apolipoprotein N-acyltransferase